MKDLPGARNDRDRWRESQGNQCCQYDMMMIHDNEQEIFQQFSSFLCNLNHIKVNKYINLWVNPVLIQISNLEIGRQYIHYPGKLLPE